MNTNIIRLIASVVVIATVHTSYGMNALCLHKIDKQLLIDYITNSGGPTAIKQIMMHNRAEYDSRDRSIRREGDGACFDHISYSLLTFESYLYSHDPSVKHIFDKIAYVEKKGGGYRQSYAQLPSGGILLANNKLTKLTEYFHETDDRYNTPYIKCVTSFAAEHVPAIEQILTTYSCAK